jgi:hypothetical protein
MSEQVNKMKRFHEEMLDIQYALENQDWAFDALATPGDPNGELIEETAEKLRTAFDSVWEACDSIDYLIEKITNEYDVEMQLCSHRAFQFNNSNNPKGA